MVSLSFKRLLFVLGFLNPWFSYAQELPATTFDTSCVQRDLGDEIRNALNKPPKVKTEKSSSLIAFPIIGSNPATGFMVGLGGQYAFKMPESSLYSMVSGSLQATTKNQYLVIFKNNIYSKKEKIFYTGDWRFQIFSQATYGLGTTAPEGGILDYQFALDEV